jgi:three-Cys-motif partner protein
MAGRNIHKEPFDEGTLLKLEIFHKYLKEWLPVFLNQKQTRINIIDFFAGQGKDVNGVSGSPLIIIETLQQHKQEIIDKNLDITVILNELDIEKFKILDSHIQKFSNEPLKVVLENKSFIASFNDNFNKLAAAANYIFLDQNGIKEITDGIFAKLINLPRTDILFFISSSYLYRFKALSEFTRYLNTERISFDENNYHSCHRAVANFYRNQIASGKEYYIGPFSLKKGSNIYGLVFGSNHTYGIEKFLKICWSLDPQRGEANYDIDADKINPVAPSLFDQYNTPKKVQVFELEMEKLILLKQEHSLYDIYCIVLAKGFQPKHVNKVLKELKTKKTIAFDYKLPSDKIHKIDTSLKITNLLWRNQE